MGMTLGLLVASENVDRHTHRQDSCFISIDVTFILFMIVEIYTTCIVSRF